jgi:uncharacterized protein
MSFDTMPGEEWCLGLLKRFDTPGHIIAHSKKVWDVGRFLGEALLRNKLPLDMELLRASCLLHDVGKYPCILDGTRCHDIRGEQILEAEGYPAVARVVVQHVILRSDVSDGIKEEHVVYYADKRVVHDYIVSVEERFEYLEKTYGGSREALQGLQWMKERTLRLEENLFRHLDFGPADLAELMDEAANY